ncbi:hypothetical protein [Peribacillus muralis]|uniref:hypothetical protein n=1 Tax=Peribacillus muralis TaxID=264697 RepID=UPI003D04C80C
MKIKDDLTINSMSLGGYEIPIPKGLSELLNRAGAWKYRAPGLTQSESPLKDYDRKVVKENGHLRTYLTYKKPIEKSRENKKVS